MARRSDHSRKEIRDMILEAADQIVVEQGAGGLSARKVASKVGYTVGTLYLVFANIDDLIMHINARTLDRLRERMADGGIQTLASKDRLLRLARIYTHFAYGDPHRWSLAFEHHPPDNRPEPQWYVQKKQRIFAIVEEALRALVPQLTRSEISQASCALWAGIQGVCILGITQKPGNIGKNSILKLADSLTTNYVQGLMA